MQKLKSIAWLMVAGSLFFLLSACGSDDSSPPSGILQLALTDAVDHNFSEVVISIKEVRAVPAGQEGAGEGGLPLIVAFDEPKVINVLELAFQQELLGEAVVPAGNYNQLRLVLAANTDPASPANYIVLADNPTLKIPLHTPSGQQSGLKVVGKFFVEAGELTTVVLDFDPARAIVEAGESGLWIFKPTGIRVVQTENFLPTYGTLIGRVEQTVAGEGDTTTQVPVTGAIVAAVPEGGQTAIAAGAVNAEDASFRLFLPPGSYELRVTADGFAPFSSLPELFTVSEGADTDAGAILLDATP
jgi:hypothetical protein